MEVATPVLTGPASGSVIAPGATITGTAAAGTTLSVQRGAEAPFDVPVAGNGTWTFAAPTDRGPVDYTITARSGYSTSAALEVSYDVVPATVITSPSEGERVVTSVQSITGVGVPGETVELSGAVAASVVVDADGTWQHAVDLTYGVHTVTVSQVTGTPSAPATTTFQVVPVAPAITNPGDGDTFDERQAPAEVSGTGIDHAAVQLTVGDTVLEGEVADGAWIVALTDPLAPGDHVVTATQAIGGAASDPVQVHVTVTAAAVAAPEVPAADNSTGGALAQTGVEAAALIAALAAMLLLAGAGAVLIGRKMRGTAALTPPGM